MKLWAYESVLSLFYTKIRNAFQHLQSIVHLLRPALDCFNFYYEKACSKQLHGAHWHWHGAHWQLHEHVGNRLKMQYQKTRRAFPSHYRHGAWPVIIPLSLETHNFLIKFKRQISWYWCKLTVIIETRPKKQQVKYKSEQRRYATINNIVSIQKALTCDKNDFSSSDSVGRLT